MKSFNEWLNLREYKLGSFQRYSRIPKVYSDPWSNQQNKERGPSLSSKFAGAVAGELGGVMRNHLQKLGYTPTVITPLWNRDPENENEDDNEEYQWEEHPDGVGKVFDFNTTNLENAKKLFWESLQKDSSTIRYLQGLGIDPRAYQVVNYETSKGKTYLQVYWYKEENEPEQDNINKFNITQPQQQQRQPNSEPLNPNVKPGI